MKIRSHVPITVYLDDLEKDGRLTDWAVKYFAELSSEVTKDRAKWQPVFDKVLSRPMPKTLFGAQLDYYKQHYPAALKAGLAKNRYGVGRFKGPAREPGSTAAVKAYFAENLQMRVLKGHQTGGWTIEKNGIGLPVSRNIGTRVLAKAPGETHCRIYEILTRQQYAGGGQYNRDFTVHKGDQTDYWVAPCN